MPVADDIIILTDEQVGQVLSPEEAFAALEQAYRDLGAGMAMNRPSSWAHVGHPDPGVVYQFVSMEGGSRRGSYFGMRLLSHLRHRPVVRGTVRVQSRRAEGERHFGGLILVFDAEDGEPATNRSESHAGSTVTGPDALWHYAQ
jgi:hypothetical protein